MRAPVTRAIKALAAAICLVVPLHLPMEPALAQSEKPPIEAPPPGQLPTAAPPELQVSSGCRTPGLSTAGDIPLPNVSRALKLRKVITILTIGASASGGRDTTPGGYYTIIERLLEKTVPGVDVRIVDRGVSGELAADAAQRLLTEVALVKPDLVLWQLGTHDALQYVSVESFRSTVSEAVDWLQKHEVDVVLVGLHYLRGLRREPHYQAIRKTLNEIAAAKRIMRIGRYEAMQVIEQAKRAQSGPAPDEFALTEDAYSCLSEYIARAVTSGVFARARPHPGPRG